MSSSVKSACPAASGVTSELTGATSASAAGCSGGEVGGDGGSGEHPLQLTGHNSVKACVQKKSFFGTPSIGSPVVPSTQNCSVRVGSAHDSGQYVLGESLHFDLHFFLHLLLHFLFSPHSSLHSLKSSSWFLQNFLQNFFVVSP